MVRLSLGAMRDKPCLHRSKTTTTTTTNMIHAQCIFVCGIPNWCVFFRCCLNLVCAMNVLYAIRFVLIVSFSRLFDNVLNSNQRDNMQSQLVLCILVCERTRARLCAIAAQNALYYFYTHILSGINRCFFFGSMLLLSSKRPQLQPLSDYELMEKKPHTHTQRHNIEALSRIAHTTHFSIE